MIAPTNSALNQPQPSPEMLRRNFSLSLLWVSVAAQATWIVTLLLRPGGNHGGVAYAAGVTIAFAVLALTRARYRWIAGLLRILIGIALFGSVGDRLGWFGGPGAPGVSWGNFANFIIYTGQVNAFLPAAVIPALAVIESIVEGVLGLALLVGVGGRATLLASTLLLLLFGVAMSVSLGLMSQFPFAVFVLAAGGWVLANADATFLSIDAWRAQRRARRIFAAH